MSFSKKQNFSSPRGRLSAEVYVLLNFSSPCGRLSAEVYVIFMLLKKSEKCAMHFEFLVNFFKIVENSDLIKMCAWWGEHFN